MSFIQFVTTRTFLKQFAYSLLITAVIVWIVMLVLKMYTRHNQIAVAPNLIGLSMNQVNQLEASKDFELFVIDSIYDYKKIPGTIISQDPEPGTKVKPGRAIYISMVSFIPEQIIMPALVDLSLRQAKALMQTYGLKLGAIRIIPDMAENAVLKFTVNGKNIKPGTPVLKGSVVDLIVGSGKGAGQPAVPFLIGKTRQEAISTLTKLGLMVGTETFEGSSDSLNALVYKQLPEFIYGKKIAQGTTFNLIYKTDNDINFEEYIRELEIDTIQPETPVQ